MRVSRLILCIATILVLIAACTPEQKPATAIPQTTPSTGVASKPSPQVQTTVPKETISADVKELLAKHKTKVNSIYYKYRGPETRGNFHEFYVKGGKIKYKPYLELKSLDQPNSYDSVFIDKIAKTAQSYCTATYCKYGGKKADLNYNEAYIATVFDWLDVTEAKKVGEEVIDARSTWKLEANKGTLWIDTFYGIPLRTDSNGKIYEFQQISINSVQDSDVMPS